MLELVKRYPAAMPAVDGGHPDWALDFNLAKARAADFDTWHPESWKTCTARQQPVWTDPVELAYVTHRLKAKPGLVAPREVAALKEKLALAVEGKAFILQGGDCSENFAENTPKKIFGTCKTLARMAFYPGHGHGPARDKNRTHGRPVCQTKVFGYPDRGRHCLSFLQGGPCQ